MSYATHLAGLAALLASVPAIGIVHDEEPFARSQAEFQAKYLYEVAPGVQQLRGWYIARDGVREQQLGLGRVMNTHTWRIQGFMALDSDQGSGKAFEGLIEAFRKAFRNDPVLGGAAEMGPVGQPSGVQVSQSGPVMFVGVLCHSARLTVQTHEYLNAGE
jgi:hypothetical protein